MVKRKVTSFGLIKMDEFTDMQSLSVIIKHIDEFGFVVTRRVHDCAKAGQN